MAKIIVLGAGMVGRAIALDLARLHRVVSADVDAVALGKVDGKNGVATTALDVTDERLLSDTVREFDLVIGAVPGFLGFRTLKTVIEAGKNVVDISFCPENTLDLDPLAKRNGVCAMVDMGVAPGMDQVLLGYHDALMTVDSFECLVGGLPKKRTWPFAYKAPFSPIDVIEEYTRPARYVENGHLVTRPALSDHEWVEFERVGTLEAFNTDGLRTLLTTMSHIPNLKEKTLRYPGHVRWIQGLKQAGFFRKDRISIGDAQLSPLEFTSRILIDEWALEPEEEEITVMRVTIGGDEGGVRKTYVYHLYDEYDAPTGISSMSRTTGYTATAAARLLLDGLYTVEGVQPPEWVGRDRRCFDSMLEYLADRGVVYRKQERADNPR